jgi:aldehyde dehydrogenase (NAD+)
VAGDRFASVNPARPAEIIAEFDVSTAADVDDAVARAADAQRSWSRVPIPQRAETIAAIGDVLADRKARLANLVSREAGKILVEAGGDVQEAIDMAGYIAGQGRNAWGETHPCEMPDKIGFTTRQPVGVVGMITPWNFPVAIPSWKIFPALLAGNGVVIKPSEHAPQCCAEFVRACVDAGVPEGLVNVVYGFGEVGAAISSHTGIRAVSFTGSVPTGRLVAAAAMSTGPRLVSLELGGKNAMVVMDDADLDLVTEGALFGAFGTAGQRCTSTSRLVVHRDVAGELVDALRARAAKLVLGDPVAPGTDVGPVIDRHSAQRIGRMVETALGEGNELVTGGHIVAVDGCEGGAFFEPTILRGATRDSYIARNEVFGPVLTVQSFADEAEAIALANDTEYGLAATIYTSSPERSDRVSAAVVAGTVWVNCFYVRDLETPFGGSRHSGIGREGGHHSFDFYCDVKTVCERTALFA